MKAFIVKQGVNIIMWGVLPVTVSLIIAYSTCRTCLWDGNEVRFVIGALISLSFWYAIGVGNSYLGRLISKIVSWEKLPTRSFIITVLISMIYTVIICFLVVYAFVGFLGNGNFWSYLEREGVLYNVLIVPLAITVVVSLFFHGRSFYQKWKRELLNVERLKNENLMVKMESLKNQINPHFLFNSLNALDSLVYIDANKASQFIQKLSEVYRYILSHQNDEIVTLAEEMRLVDAYIYLNKIRFGDNLKMEINTNEAQLDQYIPPMTIQMLLENCFKHNEVSNQCKMCVCIEVLENKVRVENNVNALTRPKEDSSGLGLKNIKARYAYLTDKRVIIESAEETFMVEVPILTEA